jgi:copper oxidase (laccase) domain-containing protein
MKLGDFGDVIEHQFCAAGEEVGEIFPALVGVGVRHAFLPRSPGVDVRVDREEALARLAEPHRQARAALGLGDLVMVTGEQVHRAEVGIIADEGELPSEPLRGVDALVTRRADVVLGIYVADCAAVYLVDRVGGAIGLVHSGKKGTAAGIVARTIRTMERTWGTRPADLLVQISPCIRPPHYEVDFAAEIVRQAWQEGAGQVVDCGRCTAAESTRYYSYRREKGRTGRMLALLAREPGGG